MFMGPIERDKPWSTNGVTGVFKFLNKAWRLVHEDDGMTFKVDEVEPSDEIKSLLHITIKKVTEDLENLSFNTAISQLMILINEMTKKGARNKSVVKVFAQLLAPFAPHMSEEIWEKLGEEGLVSIAAWPKHDPSLTEANKVTIAIQVNGKTRGTYEFPADVEQAPVEEEAKKIAFVQNRLSEGAEIKKVIFVKNRILNLIIK